MNQAPSARQLFDRFVAAAGAAPQQNAAAHANTALVQSYFEMWNTGDGSIADRVLAPSYFDHAHPEVIGPAVMRSLVPRSHAANPDRHMEVVVVAADRDFVAVQNTITSSVHGRTFTSEGIALFRVAEGKLVEQWSSYPDATATTPLAPRAALERWLAFRA